MINAISQVLEQYTDNVTVLSYTVGAPVAYGPSAAPSQSAVSSSSAGTRRSMLTADSRCHAWRGATASPDICMSISACSPLAVSAV